MSQLANPKDPRVALLRTAEELLDRLRGTPNDADLTGARSTARKLRGMREFVVLARLGEAVGRHAPEDAVVRCWYAQALIETGKATAAIDLLRALTGWLPKSSPAWGEAIGLLGRAHKQIFFDARDKHSPAARIALQQAVSAYRAAVEAGGSWTWQGINVVAVLAAARRLGIPTAPELDPVDLARRVLEALEKVPASQQDEWHAATMAEACLALGDWENVARHLGMYVTHPNVEAFHLGSTLRQFCEVWGLHEDKEHGRPLLAILQAQLIRKPGGTLELTPTDFQKLAATPTPAPGQLEAILGTDGPRTYRWMQVGLEKARSVVAIELRGIRRQGTGFLMQARDLGLDLDELVVLTNHHVVNAEGSGEAIKADSAEVVFEALSPVQRIEVEKVLWSSPPDRHDASILKLKEQPQGVGALSAGKNLPLKGGQPAQRVYVIGHPGGRELAFSLQDNELLDHEGPTKGRPAIEGVVRLHYRAPTEGGSSGSPVFNEEWSVVGLHHLGGKEGISRLNGEAGTYGANEGLWIQTIIKEKKT